MWFLGDFMLLLLTGANIVHSTKCSKIESSHTNGDMDDKHMIAKKVAHICNRYLIYSFNRGERPYRYRRS